MTTLPAARFLVRLGEAARLAGLQDEARPLTGEELPGLFARC